MGNILTLKDLKQGQQAVIKEVEGEGALRQHLLDMGIIPENRIRIIKYAPMGDPVEVRLYDYELTLRLSEAERIRVERIDEQDEELVENEETDTERKNAKKNGIKGNDEKKNDGKKNKKEQMGDTALERREEGEHPGLGETGRFHPKGTGNPLPAGITLTFALVGNQNCGKTTLFNQLTGSNQHVGNFPGVTVDRKDGVIRGYPDTLITDLPGIYSMSPYSSEELVSRDFVLNQKPKAIINIVDATNIERNMYLTLQLLELNIPMVVALNMMDEMRANGGTIDVNRMEVMLGVPVVPISAAKNQGIEELTEHAVHIAKYQECPTEQDFCDKNQDREMHRCIHSISYFIESRAKEKELPLRFAVNKLIEGDTLITEMLALDSNEKETVEHIVQSMEAESGVDRNAAMARMRFSFINRVCSRCVKKPHESKERERSRKIDKILTGKYTGIPAFIGIMAMIFYLTFNVVGLKLQKLLETGIDWMTKIVDRQLTASGTNAVLHGLLINGIFNGVGSVISFLPIIITLFFFLSILEDTGYAARVAFVMDRPLRKIGLSGRSIVPLLIGFGCTVPAVMATRTLPSERDRRMTILLAPFMSCSAKLPIYAFFVHAFFPKWSGLWMTLLYMTGILTGILAALVYRTFIFKGEAVPFVMELPNYRFPKADNILKLLKEKAKDFIDRAFTVIMMATIVIWLLQNFDFSLHMVSDSGDSILAVIAGAISVIMAPLGLKDWRIITALISGFMAKESVVSTLTVLFGGKVSTFLTPLAAATLLIFSLLYTPCVAAISTIKRELGTRWAVCVVIWQCALAWVAALIVRMIGQL